MTGVPDQSVYMARKRCEEVPGTTACSSKDFYRHVMGDTYPNITFHACHPTTGERMDAATATMKARQKRQ